MTSQEIIEMAHEAGITYVTGHGVASATFEWLDRFASLVAAREREACAKVCDAIANKPSNVVLGVAVDCAKAIRARKKK